MNEEHYRKLENMYAAAPCNLYYAPRMTIAAGSAELVIPVREEFFHAANAVHGSVYFKALDDAAFFAVNSLVKEVFVLTVTFNVYFTRPIASGEMRSIGRVLHASRRLFIAESILYNDRGKEIGRGSGSFAKSNIRLSPEMGYQ
jgi:uncharacterized protein (TIGR00369 family)